MLSIFPSLLAFEGFAPFLLRLTLGGIFIFWAYGKLKKRTTNLNTSFGVLEALVGISLIVGFLTQISAMISAIIFIVRIFQKINAKSFLTDGVNYYLILLIISVCLLFTGAGFIAFDLPL